MDITLVQTFLTVCTSGRFICAAGHMHRAIHARGGARSPHTRIQVYNHGRYKPAFAGQPGSNPSRPDARYGYSDKVAVLSEDV